MITSRRINTADGFPMAEQANWFDGFDLQTSLYNKFTEIQVGSKTNSVAKR
jgi:hypothetical protein